MDCVTLSELGERNYNADYLIAEPENGIFIIADGAGNHPTAKAASSKASHYAYSKVIDNNKHPSLRVYSAIQEANRVHEDIPGGVTTLDVLLIENNRAHLAHIGDAKVVIARKGKVFSLTKPHIDELGVLQQFIGDNSAEPDVLTYSLEKGDLIAMMTDGIYKVINNKELTEILTKDSGLEKMLDKIHGKILENIESALKFTPQDNYSIILLRY